VVEMVMNANDNAPQQKEIKDRRLLFQPEPETNAIGAPSGAPAPKLVHAQITESVVSD